MYNPSWREIASLLEGCDPNHIEEESAMRLVDEIQKKNATIAELLSALEMIMEVFDLKGYASDSGGGKCYTKALQAIANAERR